MLTAPTPRRHQASPVRVRVAAATGLVAGAAAVAIGAALATVASAQSSMLMQRLPTSRAEALLQIGAPQTLAVGGGYRFGAFGASLAYQPHVDEAFLASSWTAAGRYFLAPIAVPHHTNAFGQIFVGLAAGQYEFQQDQVGVGSFVDEASKAQGFSVKRRTRVSGAFVAPHVGFSQINETLSHLDSEVGWFLPLSRRVSHSDHCSIDAAPCSDALATLPDPTPAFVRKSGWYVTLVRCTWAFL